VRHRLLLLRRLTLMKKRPPHRRLLPLPHQVRRHDPSYSSCPDPDPERWLQHDQRLVWRFRQLGSSR
ncbi:MAG: hypothetical protein WAW42_16165, partial [Candidatus Competibacteraceae bacterium]